MRYGLGPDTVTDTRSGGTHASLLTADHEPSTTDRGRQEHWLISSSSLVSDQSARPRRGRQGASSPIERRDYI